MVCKSAQVAIHTRGVHLRAAFLLRPGPQLSGEDCAFVALRWPEVDVVDGALLEPMHQLQQLSNAGYTGSMNSSSASIFQDFQFLSKMALLFSLSPFTY